jgi:hypothetical protein
VINITVKTFLKQEASFFSLMEIMWEEDDDVAGSSSGSNNSRVVNEIYG